MTFRLAIALATATVVALPAVGHAQQAAAPAHYTTDDTSLGDMLDDPAAKAILVKYLPQMVANPQIDMARGMTLKQMQSYAADQITDAKLAQIDADLAKLPPKK
jgi:hypothetical protein